MFERFTHEARAVVVGAQEQARGLRHTWIGCEHLLLSILDRPETAGATVLARMGVTAPLLRAAIEDRIGAGARLGDADALRTLGIDLDEVRRRVEASFGRGALDVPPRRKPSRLPWRRRDWGPMGHIPFTPRAKRVLERSLREALALGDRHIGVEHLLLGVLDPKGNAAVDLLREHFGVEPEAVRAALLAELGKAA
jgi:ATP-dependent Clp protease ATP-binding subunit ClpA